MRTSSYSMITEKVFKKLFEELTNGVSYVQHIKINLKITNIKNQSQIPKPKTFPLNSFSSEIMKHINHAYDVIGL